MHCAYKLEPTIREGFFGLSLKSLLYLQLPWAALSMLSLPSEQSRDSQGRYTRNLAPADNSNTIIASSSPNMPGALPHISSPPIPKATSSSLPTTFSIQGAECQELFSQFKDDFLPSLLSASVLDLNYQLTSAMAHDKDQQSMDTTPTNQQPSAQPDTPPTPICHISQ